MCCDVTEKAVNSVDYGAAALVARAPSEFQQVRSDTSTFRNRLEARRNRLSRQLVEVEEALRLIYSNPDAERMHEIFERTGI
jgi:hypothetical protein